MGQLTQVQTLQIQKTPQKVHIVYTITQAQCLVHLREILWHARPLQDTYMNIYSKQARRSATQEMVAQNLGCQLNGMQRVLRQKWLEDVYADPGATSWKTRLVYPLHPAGGKVCQSERGHFLSSSVYCWATILRAFRVLKDWWKMGSSKTRHSVIVYSHGAQLEDESQAWFQGIVENVPNALLMIQRLMRKDS